MKRLVASLVVFVALCALAISGAQAAPPVILSVDLERGRTMHLDWGGADYYELMHIAVSDADGAADLISIAVTDPEGVVHTITPAGGPDLGWGVWDDTTVGAYWAAGQTTAPPSGAYTVTVTDSVAETDTLTTVASVAVPDLVPTLLYPAHNALIAEDTPTFSWTDVLAGAESWVYVAEAGFGPGSAWTYNAGSATVAAYNSDGTASPATLTPGHTYLWLAEARRRDDDGADPRVSITTCQGTFGTFTTYSPVPRLIHVYIDRGIDVPPSDRPITYRERMEGAYITDDDGADDVASVTLVDTDGVTHVITPTAGGNTEWLPLDPYRLYVFWGDSDLPSPPTPGVYAVTVTDKEGNSDSLTTPYAPLVSSLYPHLLYPDPDYPVIPEVAPTFVWTEGVPGATNYLNVWEPATGASLWDYASDTATSVTYNVDGSAALAELIPSHSYVWQIHAWSTDDESDPRVTIRTLQHSYGVFTVYSPLPSIQSVSITRSRTVDAEDDESFGECATIVATDCDGWEDLTITTVDPAGRVRPGPDDCGQTSGDGPYTARQNWAQWEQTLPLAAGAYTVTATDQGGHAASVVTQPVPGVPVPFEITSPANHSVISTTVPTFAWDPVPDVCNYCICLEEAGHAEPVVWSWCGTASGSPSVEYNSDGTARDADLRPGARYRLRIMAYTYGADSAHPGVWLSNSPVRIVEFRVAPQPEPVAIQGTMMVSRCCPAWPGSVYFLSGDSTNVTGAPSGIPGGGDLSPDGLKVAYCGPAGITVSNVDGSGSTVLLPGSWCQPRWSPDGEWLAFNGPTEDDPTPLGCEGGGEVFILRADGSELRRITYQPGTDKAEGWSPDGQYLLWHHRPYGPLPPGEPDAPTAWVGLATGGEVRQIAGPGFPVEAGYDPQWSPDGSRIAMIWTTPLSETEMLMTLGTVATDGSDPQPIYEQVLPDPEAWWVGPCWPRWSPDGTQVAFNSAPQVLPDPGARSDLEVYLINADGSDLRRVTHDWSDNPLSWRGPNTLPGTDVATTICDTTITFDSVVQPGVTTAVVSDVPPAPAPTGFEFIGEYYDLRTTAQVSGPMTVQIHYEDSEVPGDQEQWLSLLHWEDGRWVDVTVRPIDTVNNTITGQVASLSPFAVVLELDTAPPALTVPPDVSVTTTNPDGASVDTGVASAADDRDPDPAITSDAPAVFRVGTTVVTWTATDAAGNVATAMQTVTVTLQGYANFTWIAPMANADKRLFKRGSTIPVKFTITDMGGSPATDATATLAIRYLHDGAPEGEPLTVSTANGDEGDTFRHTADGQYVFNLSTKPPEWYPYYTFLAEVTLDDGQVFSQAFSLK